MIGDHPLSVLRHRIRDPSRCLSEQAHLEKPRRALYFRDLMGQGTYRTRVTPQGRVDAPRDLAGDLTQSKHPENMGGSNG